VKDGQEMKRSLEVFLGMTQKEKIDNIRNVRLNSIAAYKLNSINILGNPESPARNENRG
jgi:hypothetical protein